MGGNLHRLVIHPGSSQPAVTMPVILLQIDPAQLSAETREQIEKAVSGYDLWMSPNPLEEEPDRVTEVVVNVGWNVQDALLDAGSLKWHHQLSAGVDWILDRPDRANLPFVITNASGMHAAQASEQAFAMIFMLSRGFLRFIPNQKRHQWVRPEKDDLVGLSGRTLLVVGAGAIGSHIARLGRAHGMRAVGIRRNPDRGGPDFDAMHGLDALDSLLPESGVVVLVLPKTPGTEGIMGERQFSLMRRDAIFINIGRGSHVDEAALADALRNRRIHGAGCDAFATEPLPATSPLWDLDNMIISPHCSGFATDYLEQALAYFIRNMERFKKGEPMENVIDKNLGY